MIIEVEKKRVKVSMHQREILLLLSQHNQVTIGELASLLGVNSAAATKNVQRLEQKQLVKRLVDEWDRRRVLISLTNDGQSVLRASST